MTSRFSRARFGAAVVVAFFCGLVFASGFDLTQFGWAQGRVGRRRPSPAVASRSGRRRESAFEAIADHARPASFRSRSSKFAKATVNRRAVPRGRPGQLPPGIEDFFRQFQGPTRSRMTRRKRRAARASSSPKDGYILTNNHVVADADRVNGHAVRQARVHGQGDRPRSDDRRRGHQDRRRTTCRRSRSATTRRRASASGCSPSAIRSTLDFTVTAGIVSAKGRTAQGLLNPNGESVRDHGLHPDRRGDQPRQLRWSAASTSAAK